MAQSSFSLADSLTKKKRALLDRLTKAPNDESPFVIIMGNEAADTDSLASSVLLSHLLSFSSKDGKFPPSTTYIPLAQLLRSDMKLRAENEMILSILQVDASDLFFLDDIPNMDSLLRSDVFLGLTDHPQLSTLWQPYNKFESKVEIIVDHHADSKSHLEAKMRILKGPENDAVGSAVSVVIDLFKGTKEMEELPRQLADLGLAAILIDTDDLRPTPRGKATPVDLEAAHTLLKQSSFNSTTRDSFIQAAVKVGGQTAAEAVGQLPEEQDEMSIEASDLQSPKALEAASSYYRILVAMKQDVTRLSTIDLLRRDYKEQTVHLSEGNSAASDIRAGFSSVPVGLSDWVHERHSNDYWDGYWKAITDWMKQKSLDIAVVGTSFRQEQAHEDKGKHKRELILAYKQQQSTPTMFSSLLKNLESETYAAENQGDANLYLSLEQPWKGWRRIEETGKKERVGGIDKKDSWTGDENIKVAVWLQRNGRASRKVYLPAIVQALKKAAAKGK